MYLADDVNSTNTVVSVTAVLLLHGQVGAAGFLDVMAAAYLAEHSSPSLDLGTSVAVLGAITTPSLFFASSLLSSEKCSGKMSGQQVYVICR